MGKWHETLAAQVGLRVGGLSILTGAWITGSTVYGYVHSHPSGDATIGELALCAVLVLLLIIGNALLVVGPGLWKQVEIPGPWNAALMDTGQFDVVPQLDRASSVGPARIDAKRTVEGSSKNTMRSGATHSRYQTGF